MEDILFRLGARVDCDAVEPTPPRPLMAAVMTDASPEALWLVERSAAVGYVVIVVSALFIGWGVTWSYDFVCPP